MIKIYSVANNSLPRYRDIISKFFKIISERLEPAEDDIYGQGYELFIVVEDVDVDLFEFSNELKQDIIIHNKSNNPFYEHGFCELTNNIKKVIKIYDGCNE